MVFYGIACIIIFLLCSFLISFVVRYTRIKKVSKCATENIKSKEIINILRINNDYEKMLTVFKDLDKKCEEYQVEIAPDFSGYFK